MSLDLALAMLAIVMVPFAILSNIILGYAAKSGAQVGALTERTFIALDICFMLGSGAALTINRLNGHAFFPVAVATTIFSLSLIALGFVPIVWVVLWYRGKLGE